MKWIGIFVGVLFFLVLLVYAVLFTSPGNSLLAPMIEGKIDAATGIDTRLENFVLRPGRFAVSLLLSPDNRVEAEGELSLFRRSLKATYRVRLDDLAGLAPLTKIVLHGQLHADGTLTGPLNRLAVEGRGGLAGGDATYAVTLVDFQVGPVKATVSKVGVAELLQMLGKEPFSTGALTLTADLGQANQAMPEGEVRLAIEGGSIDTAAINKEFGLDLPASTYTLKADSHLEGGAVRYSVNLVSDLARLDSEGTMNPENLQTDLRYTFDTRELALFKPLTGAPLRGPFRTEGTVRGDRSNMIVAGTADVAASRTTYDLSLEELKPGRVVVKMEDGRLDKLLFLVGQPVSAKGRLDIDLNLTDLDPNNLKGDAVVRVDKGELAVPEFKKAYGLDIPPTAFGYELNAKLDGRTVAYSTRFTSDLARIESQGSVEPANLGADLTYRVDVARLELLKPVTKMPLRGPLKTSGTVKGDRKKLAVVGEADLAEGRTRYDLALEDLKPGRVVARTEGARLDKLLFMLEQPPYATGRLEVDLNLTGLDPENLLGRAAVKIDQGKLEGGVFKKEYKVDLPDTPFTFGVNAELKGKAVDYQAKFDAKPAKFESKGSIVPKSMGLNLDYRADIANLGLLQPLVGIPMRGRMKLGGTVRGDRQKLSVEGTSDLADSETVYKVVLAEFSPASIVAKIKNLKLGKALALVGKPHYADGVVNIDVNVSDARAGSYKGEIDSVISGGVVDGKVMSREFEWENMPATTFEVKAHTTLAGNNIDTAATVASTLATLKVTKARYDKGASLLTGDYRAEIPDLDRFYFVSGRHLKGALTVIGDMKKGEHLELNAHSETLGGALDATVRDDDVHADLKNIQTLDALKMLIYPEVFSSVLVGTFDYNLKGKKGKFVAKLRDGQFTPNIMLELLRSMAGTDLYKERFTAALDSDIKAEVITSDLDMKSDHATITTRKATLNTKSRRIDARLDVVANNNPVGVKIKGSVDKPEVKLDVQPLIKKEAEKVLKKEVDKLLRKLF